MAHKVYKTKYINRLSKYSRADIQRTIAWVKNITNTYKALPLPLPGQDSFLPAIVITVSSLMAIILFPYFTVTLPTSWVRFLLLNIRSLRFSHAVASFFIITTKYSILWISYNLNILSTVGTHVVSSWRLGQINNAAMMIIIYLLIHRCMYFFGCIYLRLK